jgi:hypothetical protein
VILDHYKSKLPYNVNYSAAPVVPGQERSILEDVCHVFMTEKLSPSALTSTTTTEMRRITERVGRDTVLDAPLCMLDHDSNFQLLVFRGIGTYRA